MTGFLALQGSLYYYVHRHAIMSFFLNRLRFDAMVGEPGIGQLDSFQVRMNVKLAR